VGLGSESESGWMRVRNLLILCGLEIEVHWSFGKDQMRLMPTWWLGSCVMPFDSMEHGLGDKHYAVSSKRL
jgi:hypothetical protein